MNTKKLSRNMSLALRHRPAFLNITLDEHGWASVDALLAGLAARNYPITRDELFSIVATSDKQRFALSDDGTRIRANQGHSVSGIDLQLSPAQPPARLYHGTVAKAIEGIRASGLKKMKRHHVHLSADVDTSMKVGGRRGEPIILSVDAKAMTMKGHTFFQSDNGVWLTDAVPPVFLTIPAVK
ncbi:RNA 2'-phosphotransferase [Carpediemonas membranifera]|uniref:2'-phosphotransferase n=1 Tax=Carpediemonas membranifera TaxID=201153 RepID=A0A8J6DY82_9EUKA|nr:RNA 2'-phosphotransferase [Carpediemonas membranifera]|eukprot:KAG9391734.1 RNA 2'-phosphotransferase [Carpediemonas membranifera]